MSEQSSANRRDVLKATGGVAIGGMAASGMASAAPDEGDSDVSIERFDDDQYKQFNVTFDENVVRAQSARRTIKSLARTTVHSFNFSAMTVEMKAGEAKKLDAKRGYNVQYDAKMHKLGSESGDLLETMAQEVPWGMERIGAPKAHENGYKGDGASVAVIDTGVQSNHPDLQANLGKGKGFSECGGNLLCSILGNGNDCNEKWDDDQNHGTHCAGIVGAADNDEGVVGVSPNVTIHPVKVLNCLGSGDMSNVAKGIEWAADQGVDVASMSLGSAQESNVVTEACNYADEKGTMLIAAAGNDGEKDRCSGNDCVGYPAALDSTIAVSATAEGDKLASFSSTGPEIDIAAPGKDIKSTVYDGYKKFSGTSMACPHVSGAAAQLFALGASRQQVKDLLLSEAVDIGLSDAKQGQGLLQIWKAIQAYDGDPPEEGEIDITDLTLSDSGNLKASIDASDLAGDLKVKVKATDTESSTSDSESDTTSL